jgi:hypothetical protein
MMIVKFSHEFVTAVHSATGVAPAREKKPPVPFTVMTDDGARKVNPIPRGEDPPADAREAPDWLRNELLGGSHVVMRSEDYVALPESVRGHATIIRG